MKIIKKQNYLYLILIFSVILTSTVLANTNIYEFYQPGCSHCTNVDNSGILEKVAEIEGVTLTKLDIRTPEGYDKYEYYHDIVKDMPRGTPLAVIECDNEINYLVGDSPIIENLEQVAKTCTTENQTISIIDKFKGFLQTCFNSDINAKGKLGTIGLSALVIAAIIDSINPCAFGVLLFLMLSLLNLGSSKRALKAGLLYSLIVFIVYFLAGLGIFKIIQSVAIIKDWIYLIVGILVLILSLIEFRDFYYATKGKESILRISPKIKPFIEKYSKKGTILAIMTLGVVVAIFELPCTGGIYIAIISLLSQTPEYAVLYLIIYNIIFVLPLIIITLLIYKGASPENLQKWSNTERSWMKLTAAIIMLILATFLLYHPIKILIGLC